MIILSYLLAGVFAGLVAGLLGVGGGVVVVPILIIAFESQGISDHVLTHMAIATSLATIIFTSLSSIWNHHQNGAVLWPVFKPIGLGIVAGAILGVFTVIQLDGELLKRLIGIFAILVALKMLVKKASSGSRPIPSNASLIMAGGVIGWISSMFGIGGGTLSVPFLSRTNIDMKKVVGTAAACGLPIAVFGAATNVVLGYDVPNRPDWSLGYIYVPACLGVVLMSVYFARVGAKLAHKISSEKLRTLFAVLLLLVGVRFLVT